jgi:hypothetical protein
MRPWHRLRAIVLVVGFVAGAALPRANAAPSADLGANGIGAVRFGLPKAQVVRELTTVFGAPIWRGVNTGCGPLWTEVVWDDLAAEFRGSTFTGYRYAPAVQRRLGSPSVPGNTALPRLATANGITLGSTLGQLRSVYRLHLSGAGKWNSGSLVFVSNAEHEPAPLSSRIIEIKTTGTCGDY